MDSVTQKIEAGYKKKTVTPIQSGDTVRVHQKVKEAGKERVQIFEGLVIKISRRHSLSAAFTVRRIASGVGVEKTYLMHSPGILKIEVVKRSKIRRNYLAYMRRRHGRSARLAGIEFDKNAINAQQDEAAEAEEAKIHEAQLESYDPEAAKAEKEAAKAEATKADVEEALKPEKTPADKIEEKSKARASAKAPAEDLGKAAKPTKTVDAEG